LCGTTSRAHAAKGLCQSYYDRVSEQIQKTHLIDLGEEKKSRKRPSRDQLLEDYSTEMSLIDLARKYKFTRQYLYKLLKLYDIPRRSNRVARTLAIAKGKISSTRVNELGEREKVAHEDTTRKRPRQSNPSGTKKKPRQGQGEI